MDSLLFLRIFFGFWIFAVNFLFLWKVWISIRSGTIKVWGRGTNHYYHRQREPITFWVWIMITMAQAGFCLWLTCYLFWEASK